MAHRFLKRAAQGSIADELALVAANAKAIVDLGERSLEAHYRLEYERAYRYVLAAPKGSDPAPGSASEVTAKLRLAD